MPKNGATTQEDRVKAFEQQINFISASKDQGTQVHNRLDNHRHIREALSKGKTLGKYKADTKAAVLDDAGAPLDFAKMESEFLEGASAAAKMELENKIQRRVQKTRKPDVMPKIEQYLGDPA